MTQAQSDKTKTLLEHVSSLGSLSELQEDIFNLESFTNYSFSKTQDKKQRPYLITFKHTLKVLSALTLIAFFTALVACFIDITAFNLIKGKKSLALILEDPYFSCAVWVSISLLFITCATSFGYFFAPEVDGSGIPEVKSIISGVEMPNYLTKKTLICKTLGLVCCSGALSVGKEGPHAHLAAIIAHQVLSFSYFKSLKSHPGIKTQIMEASVAAGVSAVMAAPIGSVFFSMELTSTHYMIPNIVLALYCGTLSSFLLTLYRLLNLTEVVNHTHIPEGFNNADLFVFILIGLIAGVIGASFTIYTKKLVEFRALKKIPWLHRRFRYAWTVTFFYSTTSFVLPFMIIGAKQALNQLLTSGDLPSSWEYCGGVGSLIAFLVLKLFFTGLSTSVQIPGGVIMPLLLSGAAFGRIMHILAAYLGGRANVAMFAAVSGASFVASSCHSLSISLILFEMTGQIHYAIPMLLSVIISYSIGSSIGLNIFDAFILFKKIPYLPAIRKSKLYRTNPIEIMDSAVSIPYNSNLKQMRDAIVTPNTPKVAVVDENQFIVAEFNVANGKKYLVKVLDGMKEMISKEKYDQLKYNFENVEFVDKDYEKMEKLNFGGFDPEHISSYFWGLPVDFTNKSIKLNKSPISVEISTSLYKIHYLFLMLGMMQLYITKEFKLSGVIYRHYFTTRKK